MKKLISLILALVLVITLAACGSDSGKPDSVDQGSGDKDPVENSGADGKEQSEGDTVASNDFTAASGFALSPESLKNTGEKYKIAYVGFSWDNTVEHMANAIGQVVEGFGCEYQAISSDGNPDTFISNIENYISQGYDGLICNTYTTTSGRACEILEEAGIPWMPATSAPLDYDDNIVTPYVGVEDSYVGAKLTQEALDWAEENWEDFDIKDAYIYIIDVSTASELHARVLAMEEEAKKLAPDAAAIDVGDSIAEGGGFSPEVAYNMCVRTFAANPDVKYWIVLHPFDYYISGTCRAAEDYNIVDNVCTVCCNGDNYLPVLKDGTSGCWRFCLYWDNGLWGYLYGCGLYAMVSGQCTKEELWNDYIVEGTDYANLRMASLVMGPDNYKDVLGFYDHLLGNDYFGFEADWSGTEYPILYTGEE